MSDDTPSRRNLSTADSHSPPHGNTETKTGSTIHQLRRFSGIFISDFFIDKWAPILSPSELCIFICICRLTNTRNGYEEIPISYSSLERASGLSRSTVIRCVKSLEHAQLLIISSKINEEGSKDTNNYQVNPEDLYGI